MTQINYSVTINAQNSKVWDMIADLGYIQNWNPGVTKSYYNTEKVNGVGAGRICELAPMGKIEEIATHWEEGKSLTLEIAPVEKVPPFKNCTAEITLNELSNDKQEVHFEMKYEMGLGLIGKAMNSMMVKKNFITGVSGLMEGLKVHVEQGTVIDTVKTLKNATLIPA